MLYGVFAFPTIKLTYKAKCMLTGSMLIMANAA